MFKELETNIFLSQLHASSFTRGISCVVFPLPTKFSLSFFSFFYPVLKLSPCLHSWGNACFCFQSPLVRLIRHNSLFTCINYSKARWRFQGMGEGYWICFYFFFFIVFRWKKCPICAFTTKNISNCYSLTLLCKYVVHRCGSYYV